MTNSHIELIQSLIENDSEDPQKQSDILEQTYTDATKQEKEIIDNIMICLCGYSLDTVIKEPDNIG